MSRLVYVDGRYLPYGEAGVHVEDRGFQFGDAVYEVCEIRSGRLVDEARHVERLLRSLAELEMPLPMSAAALALVMRETIRRNRVRHGSLYLQVSRGARPREFVFPSSAVPPTVVVIARHGADPATMDQRAEAGIKVISAPDMRWGRCDIKTVMLLPACLAKERARAVGAKEAWLVDAAGYVTEGASSNAWIVTRDGELVTRPADHRILRGVTRTTLIDVLRREGLRLVERPFTIAEAQTAREAFITSATNIVMPVIEIDGAPIANGRAGSVAVRLRQVFHDVADIARD